MIRNDGKDLRVREQGTVIRDDHASKKNTAQPEIIMVTAYGREELIAQAEAAGIAIFLVKPVSPSTLLDAVVDAMGHGSEPGPETVSQVPAPAQLRGARVLLVEDNEINQQVAAQTVEDLIKEGKDSVTALTELERTLRDLIECMPMPRRPETCEREVASAIAADELDPMPDRLQVLLEDGDAEAVDMAEQLASRIEDETARKCVRGICRHLDDFEFDEAVDHMSALREAMGSSAGPG